MANINGLFQSDRKNPPTVLIPNLDGIHQFRGFEIIWQRDLRSAYISRGTIVIPSSTSCYSLPCLKIPPRYPAPAPHHVLLPPKPVVQSLQEDSPQTVLLNNHKQPPKS